MEYPRHPSFRICHTLVMWEIYKILMPNHSSYYLSQNVKGESQASVVLHDAQQSGDPQEYVALASILLPVVISHAVAPFTELDVLS